MVPAERCQRIADGAGSGTSDAGVDLVEDQRDRLRRRLVDAARGRGAGRASLSPAHHPMRLGRVAAVVLPGWRRGGTAPASPPGRRLRRRPPPMRGASPALAIGPRRRRRARAPRRGERRRCWRRPRREPAGRPLARRRARRHARRTVRARRGETRPRRWNSITSARSDPYLRRRSASSWRRRRTSSRRCGSSSIVSPMLRSSAPTSSRSAATAARRDVISSNGARPVQGRQRGGDRIAPAAVVDESGVGCCRRLPMSLGVGEQVLVAIERIVLVGVDRSPPRRVPPPGSGGGRSPGPCPLVPTEGRQLGLDLGDRRPRLGAAGRDRRRRTGRGRHVARLPRAAPGGRAGRGDSTAPPVSSSSADAVAGRSLM